MANTDNRLKYHRFTKVSESGYGATYVSSTDLGQIELRIIHIESDILVESAYHVLKADNTYAVLPYALSYKVLRLVDKKIRELSKKYNWGVSDAEYSGSRNTDSRKQSK